MSKKYHLLVNLSLTLTDSMNKQFTGTIVTGIINLFSKTQYAIPGELFLQRPKEECRVHVLIQRNDVKEWKVVEVKQIWDKAEWVMDEIKKINKLNEKIGMEENYPSSRVHHNVPHELIINQLDWDILMSTVKNNMYPLLIGPKGCGKTLTSKKIAEELEYDFYKMNCGSITNPKKAFVGAVHAKDGNTFLIESEFLKAFKSDKPTIIFLDEVSRISSQGANYIMTATDREQNYIYVEETGEMVYKGKDVIFIAAGNFGAEYTDTRALDGAFLDRFIKVRLDYLSEEEEINLILKRYAGIDLEKTKKLVEISRKLRKEEESLGQAISTRQVLDVASYIPLGFSIMEITNNIMMNIFINGNDDRRDVAEQIINATL